MVRFSIFCVFLLTFNLVFSQTVEVVNKQGTILSIDQSKWTLSGTNIYNDNSGNVGIGITNPSSKLHIIGDARISGGFLDSSGDIGTSGQILSSTGVLTNWVSPNLISWSLNGNSSTNPSTNFIGTTDNQDLVFRSNDTEKSRLFSLVRPSFGIGRNSLTGVNGGASNFSGPTLFLGNASNISSSAGLDFIIDDDNDTGSTSFKFKSKGDGASGTIELMEITESGNIGIGTTTTPSQKLEVIGNILLNSEGSAIINDFGGASRLGIVKKSGSPPFIGAGNNQPIVFSQLTTAGQTNLLGNIGNGFTERMRIDGNGNVGIGGGFTPSNLLHLGSSTSPLRYIQLSNSTTGNTTNDGTIFGINANGDAVINNRESLPLVFSTTNTERMRIDGNGNVGIGINNPSYKLHVVGNSNLVGNVDVNGNLFVLNNILDSDGNPGTTGQVLSSTGIGTDWVSLATASSTEWSRTGNDSTNPSVNFIGTTDAFDLRIRTNNLERISITSSGNVGIGTTTPSQILSLGGDVARTFQMERHTTANTAGNNLTLLAGGATSAATDKNGGKLLLSSGIATGTGSSNIEFQTATAGTSGTGDRTPSTKMTILGNGNVGIGINNPSQLLEVAGNIYLNTEGTAIVNDVTQSRLGLVKRSGYLPVIAAGSATPILFGTWSTANLLGSIATGNFTERMRIASNGDVGIGIATGAGTAGPNPTAKFHTKGTLRFESLGTNTANVNVLTTDASGNVTTRDLSNLLTGSALTSLNGLTASVQTFATGSTGTDFGISSTGSVHTFSLPNASASNRGLLTSADWTSFNNKQNTLVSGTDIKTLEGQSVLGSGNIDLSKTDVGLASVDNTSDANKPISTATQTALDLKQNTLVSGTDIKTINNNSILGVGDLAVGTVTSLALNTGTIGTDINISGSPVTSNGTITLNIPTASATNRGALNSTDWATFNNKIGIVTATTPAAVTTTTTTATINNDTANWNANKLQDNNISITAPANGEVLKWDSTTSNWTPKNAKNFYVKTTATQTTNSATVDTNITGLTASIISGKRYNVDCKIIYSSAATTTGISIGTSYSSTGTILLNVNIPNLVGTTDSAAGLLNGFITSNGDRVISASTPVINTDYMLQIEGILLPTSNGTFQVFFRSEIAGSNVSVKPNSFCNLEEY